MRRLKKMLCQRCGKKEATVHLTKIINGEKTELYLCEDCAKETGQIPFEGSDSFSFNNLLSGILNPGMGSLREDNILRCDNCGMTYKEFTEKGLFGCSHCYDTFKIKLEPLLKRIHGSSEHNGKVPKRRGGDLRIKREIDKLRKELQLAVNEEKFERAAELRDSIHNLENGLGGE
jgi:protein arginine kinase activator